MLDTIKLLHNKTMNLVTNMEPEENNLVVQGLLRLLYLGIKSVSTVRNT